MTSGPSMFRVVALLAAGALSLHELRYLVGHGEQAGQVEAAQGHGYLAVCGPFVGALLTLAGAHFVALFPRAPAPGIPTGSRPSPVTEAGPCFCSRSCSAR